ncbi:hypothetical protein RCL1_008256 [Eukaryota sp. TZLM3-RCL]
MTSTSTFTLDPALCLPALTQIKDVTLIFKSLNIEASILVLSLNSEYFANEMILYDKDTFEGQFDFSSVIDVEEECFSLFIDAFYGKKVVITGKLFPDFCHLASYFSFKTLKEACLTASLASKTTFEFKLDPQELFKKLLNWENSKYDQKLLFQAESFNVHRFVLTTVSGYFAKFWGSNFQDSNDLEKDYSHLKVLLSSFKQFITLFYLQEIEINTENFYDFYYLANYFQVKQLTNHLNSLLNILLSDINYLQSFIKSADNNEDMVAIEATLNHVQTASWQNVAPFPLRFESLEKLVSTGRVFVLQCLAESVGDIGSGNFFRVLSNFPFSNISSQILFDVIIRPFIDDAEMSQNLIAKFGEALFSSTDVCHDLVYWVLSHVRMAKKLPNYLKNRLLVIEPNFWNFDPLVMSNQIIAEILEMSVPSENFVNWIVESLYLSAFDNRDISKFLKICSNYLKDVETKFLGISGLNFYSKFIEKFNSHPSFSKICNEIFVSKVLPCLNASPSNVTITYKSKEYIVSGTKFSSSNLGATPSSYNFSALEFSFEIFEHFFTFLNTSVFHKSLTSSPKALIDAALTLESVPLLNEIFIQFLGHGVPFAWSAWTRPLSCDFLKNISISKLSWITRLFLIAGLIQDLQPIEPTPLRRSKKKGKGKSNVTTPQQQNIVSTSSNSNVLVSNLINSLCSSLDVKMLRINKDLVASFLTFILRMLSDRTCLDIPLFSLLLIQLASISEKVVSLPFSLSNVSSLPCSLLQSDSEINVKLFALYNSLHNISDYEKNMKVIQHIDGNDDLFISQVNLIKDLPSNFVEFLQLSKLNSADAKQVAKLSIPLSLLISEIEQVTPSSLSMSMFTILLPIITTGKRFVFLLKCIMLSEESIWSSCLELLLKIFDWKLFETMDEPVETCSDADYLKFESTVNRLKCPLSVLVVRYLLLGCSSTLTLPQIEFENTGDVILPRGKAPVQFILYIYNVYCQKNRDDFNNLLATLGDYLELPSNNGLVVDNLFTQQMKTSFEPFFNGYFALLVYNSVEKTTMEQFAALMNPLNEFVVFVMTNLGTFAGCVIAGTEHFYASLVNYPGQVLHCIQDQHGYCQSCRCAMAHFNFKTMCFPIFNVILTSGRPVAQFNGYFNPSHYNGYYGSYGSYCYCITQYLHGTVQRVEDIKILGVRAYRLLKLSP